MLHPYDLRSVLALVPAVVALFALSPAPIFSQFEEEPINYGKAPLRDPLAKFQERLDRGEARLEYDHQHGYLTALLKELKVPASSQVLVFSKTSFQRELISPSAPRAIYFSDDVYVGWVQGGEVVELAAVDPWQGAIFYTLDQKPVEKPRMARRNSECLQCHASALTNSVPGVLVRSVYPDARGLPVLKAGAFRTDHSSPLPERWGGWYVTGQPGEDRHLGNTIFTEAQLENLSLPPGANAAALGGRFDTAPYLSPHSDVVALMVLEHQTWLHNLITHANYQARLALRDQAALNAMRGVPEDQMLDSTRRRFEDAVKPLLKYLLFVDETPLGGPIRGTSSFAAEFASLGPKDRKGRSLRDLDLSKRLFRFPCSYLIYSESLDRLPAPMKDAFFERLWQVLAGSDGSADFARLSSEDRRAILEILLDTREGLPSTWKIEKEPERAEEL